MTEAAAGPARTGWLGDAERLDLALYEAIARTDTPHLDRAMRSLYSRVHSGVHYPGDVLVGALVGTAIAQGTTYIIERS